METEAAIQRSLKHIAHGRTIVMIAHRLSTIVHADNIVVMDHGKLLEQGRMRNYWHNRALTGLNGKVQTGGA